MLLPDELTPNLLSALIGGALVVAGVVVVLLEQRGRHVAVRIKAKRDFFRELAWVAQYGQGVCVATAIALVWAIDAGRRWSGSIYVLACVAATWLVAYTLKRAAGRVRPDRKKNGVTPGAFLGPAWRSASWRESFPSSHAATAVALSGSLATLYPQAALVFWILAAATALLRWLLEAHWLGDVLVGVGVGLLATAAVTRIGEAIT